MSSRARFRTSLEEAGLVHVDASVLALHALGHPRYVELTRLLLAGLRAGDFHAQTSALVLYQLLIEPYRHGADGLAERAATYLETLPGLRIVPVTPAIAHQAAQVKAQLGGSSERAVHIATALAGDAELFVTQRSALRRIAGMTVESLEAFAPSGAAGDG